jgi:hypothetical protein
VGGQTRGAVWLALTFLVLFASRQKERKAEEKKKQEYTEQRSPIFPHPSYKKHGNFIVN